MKILCLGNKDRGSLMAFSIVLLSLFLLLCVPILRVSKINIELEQKKYQILCERIEKNNTEIREAYEIN